MIKKERYISNTDYELLKKLYPNNIDEIIKKINDDYPIQYLIGDVDFYGYQIKVDERALIPRFETEGLVDNLIKLLKNETNYLPLKILEIGTGSGCIAITLSKELDTTVDALDISKDAIDLASSNAVLNNANVNFALGDIKNCSINKKYNILVSNPPYVKYDEPVDPATKYEPQNALFAHNNGLEFYEIILKRSKEFLETRNIIAFEIGCTEGEDITNIAKLYYPNAFIQVKKDLAGKDRYIFIINE